MDNSEGDINKLCKEILSGFEEFQRLDSLHRRITFALQQPDSLREKSAWKQLQAYRTDTDEKDIEFESADNLEEQRSQRSQRQEELAEAEGQVAEKRDVARVELISLIEDLVSVLGEKDDTKKEKIISLKRAVRSDLRGDIIADALNCSSGYPGKFRWQDDQQKVILRDDVANRSKNRFSDSQKATVKKRDNHECVRCGSDSDLQVHHIIPIADGGTNETDNGATLCKSCHQKSHRWDDEFGEQYETTDEFWEWAESYDKKGRTK